jgi:tetratricopeptide (TPR) repeat protein
MYRERSNGERMDNFIIEFGILMTASQRIVNLIILDTELNDLQKDRMQMLCYEKMAEIGYFHLNSDEGNQIYRLDREQINHILDKLSSIEISKALIYTVRCRFDLAEIACQRSLSYARRYEGGGKEKADLLCGAFKAYSNLRRSQDNYAEGVKFAEEAYNCVAEAYDPVHPHVQSAAGLLIALNIHMGNYFDAERFASLTLESLKDPRNKINQVSDKVAEGCFNLGNVLMELKDLDKAEQLVRESLRIRVLLHGNNHSSTGHVCGLLASILQLQGNLSDETEKLYERALAICVVNEGSMGLNTSLRNADLGRFYSELLDTDLTPEKEKECVRLSTFYYKEYLRTSACKLGTSTAHP